jgi:hypothetical protein
VLVIGIDPDREKSGVALWDTESKRLTLQTLTFFELFSLLNKIPVGLIRLEAGHLINHHWTARKGISVATIAKIASDTGANHETGRKILEMAKYLSIPCELVLPQGKKNHIEFQRLTKYSGRTNPEMRDAGMMVYGLSATQVCRIVGGLNK